MRKLPHALTMTFTLIHFAWLQAAAPPQPWTVDDVVMTSTPSGFRISHDGRHVIWVNETPDNTHDRVVSHLYLSRLQEKVTVQLTRGEFDCRRPRWSPDGKHIAFLTDRPLPKGVNGAKAAKGKQIWLMHPFGGEPWPLTTFPRSVKSFDWTGNKAIVFAAKEKPARHEMSLKEKKDSTQIVEDAANEPPVRLFKISLKTKKVTRITNNTDWIEWFALSPDGRWAATYHNRSLSHTFDHKIKPAVFLYDFKSGKRKRIFNDRAFNIRAIHWTKGSKGFYATSLFSNHPRYLYAYIQELYYFDVNAGTATKVNLDWDNGLAWGLEGKDGLALTNDGFIAFLANGARHKPARFVRQGNTWKRAWLTGKHSGNLFSIYSGSGGAVFVCAHSTASSPTTWHLAALGKNKLAPVTQVAALGFETKGKQISKTEIVRWKGALNEEVEGILHYPHGYLPGKKYPLVVMIHGGPAGCDFDSWEERWSYCPNLVCQRGAFVLKPNYHGSTNYGLKFVESIANGKYYEYPVADIEKGVQHLVKGGMVDPGKVGLSGWSNGAILTMALITENPRYAAAVAGAGGSEWVADWGACTFGMSFSNYYQGKSPLEDPQLYIKNAPFYRFSKVRTPTLLLQGTKDRIVPAHHAWMQYRALQQLGKTDVRLVLFPGEKHGLKKLTHRRRRISEELAWFDRHLFRTIKPSAAALKPKSPLAQALKRKDIKRHNGRYGVLVNGVMCPETVLFKNVHVGRFEVTRAQFQQFDKSYQILPGKENYPANNITFEKAKAYCDWLSRACKKRFRLGAENELKAVYRESNGKENTLDYWAGYEVNPEDRKRLAPLIAKLGGPAGLLKQVGSFDGVGGETLVFDLGGNVAEWTIGANAKGVLIGGSADRPADAFGSVRTPSLACTGFRVALEKNTP